MDSNERKILLDLVRNDIQDPTKGLPKEVFLFATEVTPMVNVDLLIKDDRGRILLSWRDDEFYEPGWHIPGGILRLKERLEDRIQKTALHEIGSEVICDNQPIEIVPIISPEKQARGHFISFVYRCSLPDGFIINNDGKKQTAPGYLQWHDFYPDNMLKVHWFYRKYFKEG